MKMKVAAVVVTYNRAALLEKCLQSLVCQTVQPEIWVVDNASTDETQTILSHWNVNIVQTGKNLGGAGGFAFGIEQAMKAGCDALWLMDDDCQPDPMALEQLVEADAGLPDGYGWLSSRALTPEGNDQPMNCQRATPYRDIGGYDGEKIPAVMASFVSLFLRADTVRRFGLPIAEFFIWSDDWEYTRRISRQLPCYVIPQSRVIHAMQQSTVVNLAKDKPERWPRYRYYYRNDVVLYRREGFRGWLWLAAKYLWHSMQILVDGQGRRFYRLKIVWNGFWAGIKFRPSIRYVD